MDISKAMDIVIKIENRQHKAEFLQKTPDGKIIFKILERDHAYMKTLTEQRCQILLTLKTEMGLERCFVEGRILSQSIDTAIVVASNVIMPNYRREVRYETPATIARLEKKAFLRTHVINARIFNISKSGAAIATKVPLHIAVRYKLESNFNIHRSLKPFSAVFTVRHCIKKGPSFISGGIFETQSMMPEHRKTLDRFLTEL